MKTLSFGIAVMAAVFGVVSAEARDCKPLYTAMGPLTQPSQGDAERMAKQTWRTQVTRSMAPTLPIGTRRDPKISSAKRPPSTSDAGPRPSPAIRHLLTLRARAAPRFCHAFEAQDLRDSLASLFGAGRGVVDLYPKALRQITVFGGAGFDALAVHEAGRAAVGATNGAAIDAARVGEAGP